MPRTHAPRRLILCAALFFLAALLLASGGGEKDSVVRVTGRVRLVGSAVFTEIVITGQDMEWYIEKDEAHKLMDFQHRTVTVEGNETIRPLTFANGLPAGERRTLRNIKIIAFE